MDIYKGDADLIELHELISELTNIWDDLIDKDKPVSDSQINKAFKIALIKLPSNPVYKQLDVAMPFFWGMAISSYETANFFEKNNVERELEISHGLRNQVVHILSAGVRLKFNEDESQEIIRELWRFIFEDSIDDYKKEHLLN